MTADVVDHDTADQQTATPQTPTPAPTTPTATPAPTTPTATPVSATPTAKLVSATPATSPLPASPATESRTTTGQETGTGAPLAADEIRAMRTRIDEIDQAIIDLWQERSHLSQQVGKTRMASGGTRLVLSREREIVERFRAALGPDGTQVALLLLRSGRGPL